MLYLFQRQRRDYVRVYVHISNDNKRNNNDTPLGEGGGIIITV